ncbi:MAG: ABC transporter ATP-binding protein/permease, partial [Armatimonadetes bacterium]|nr:ABC transporter ATP-binding protein/permease [Armatimonadota bacterium]
TLDAVPTIVDTPGAKAIGPVSGRIEFQDVHFSYIPERKVLNGLSFKIEPGQYLGVVGPSGAGKSSVLSLLLRLYLPAAGRVLVDGQDVNDIKIASLLEQIGTVPQTTNLYSGTIAENILFGNPKATENDLKRVALLSGVTAFAQRFPAELETEIGEGSTISGGERQRIGIARALIRNPKIFVLDEATANLDPETEAGVLQEIEVLRGQRTIISVAHRLKAVQTCDRILVLDSGKAAQFGTHDELVRADGLYRKLWLEQTQEVASA